MGRAISVLCRASNFWEIDPWPKKQFLLFTWSGQNSCTSSLRHKLWIFEILESVGLDANTQQVVRKHPLRIQWLGLFKQLKTLKDLNESWNRRNCRLRSKDTWTQWGLEYWIFEYWMFWKSNSAFEWSMSMYSGDLNNIWVEDFYILLKIPSASTY